MPNLRQKNKDPLHAGDPGRCDESARVQPESPLHDPRTRSTDFSSWERQTLESFARDVSAECRALQADLKVAIDAYRRFMRGGK